MWLFKKNSYSLLFISAADNQTTHCPKNIAPFKIFLENNTFQNDFQCTRKNWKFAFETLLFFVFVKLHLDSMTLRYVHIYIVGVVFFATFSMPWAIYSNGFFFFLSVLIESIVICNFVVL